MRKRVLINASNLHVGGGVQVATSFIADIARLRVDFPVVIWASTKVAANLQSLGVDLDCFEEFRVVNSLGLRFLVSRWNRRLSEFNVVFTVFGPLYSLNRSATKITGFAQGWIIYPANEARPRLGLVARLVLDVKSRVQRKFFSLSDVYVVELDHVKAQLRELGLARDKPVEVARNCVSSVFFSPKLWVPLNIPHEESTIKIGFLGRNYVHKNVSVFPGIKRALFDNHGLQAEFFVTFTTEEWEACSAEFRSSVRNVGDFSSAMPFVLSGYGRHHFPQPARMFFCDAA
jgi:hypothetical protein